MGIWAWVILLAISAALATAGQVAIFRSVHSGATDYDWVYIAGGALLGGFTAQIWYGAAWNIGPVVDGLYLVPVLLGAIVLGALAEVVYRAFIRPRQTA